MKVVDIKPQVVPFCLSRSSRGERVGFRLTSKFWVAPLAIIPS